MNPQAWIYWFPVALAAGLAGAIFGRRRGMVISIVGAGYWLMLSIFGAEGATPLDWVGAAIGAVAIIWLGLATTPSPTGAPKPAPASPPPVVEPRPRRQVEATPLDQVTAVANSFTEWLAANREQPDPWPEFGEFIRSTLYEACGATHVRPYRLLSDDDQLYPLRLTDPEERDFPSARGGVIGHVVTSGKGYRVNDPTHGELVEQLAQESDDACVWCFAIRADQRSIGVVRVGAFQDGVPDNLALQRTLEMVIGLCWITLTETCRGRLAGATDPVSGVMTYQAFMESAARALDSSYEHMEPVAVIHVSVEGLRGLRDQGRWDRANEALFEISSLLKMRVRQDDVIGALDGNTFVLVLRRVDSELAGLIVRQLAEKFVAICADVGRWGHQLNVRAGVAGSGIEQPTLRTLLSRATAKCHEARRQGVNVLTDLSNATGVTST